MRSALPLLLAAPLAAAITAFDCSAIVLQGRKYNLSPLTGPHAAITSRSNGVSLTNTSYTVDLCRPLERSGDVPKGDECPTGTRVCAIRRMLSLDGRQDAVQEVIAVAGDLEIQGGGALDARVERLGGEEKEEEDDRRRDGNDDGNNKREGLRVVFNGGAHFLHDPASKKRKQRAVIDFYCDPDRTGLEGFWSGEDHWKGEEGGSSQTAKRDDDDDDDDDKMEDHDEHQLKYPNSALVWDSYGPSDSGEDRVDVLKMTWHTNLVCSTNSVPGGDGDSPDSARGWGFFTWFIIIAFLTIATYLVLGSWLNYQRHGARGCDLVPHADVLRDLPYLLGDWVRRVLNSVQGAGSRGGYTAV